MYKILIVDDEADIRNGYARFFPWEEQGFTVAGTAEDGIKALAFLQEHPIDVVLCDIVMPNMDGLTLAEHVVEAYPAVKVIILSDHRNFEYARKAMRSNVCFYVLKSDKHSVLIGVLAQIRQQLEAESGATDVSVVEKVRRHIRENIATANLQSAAEAVHMNQNYLSRLFKEKTGENFYAYILRLRIEKAKELLSRTGMKVADVSDLLGYSDPKNFNRIFKKLTGVSPKEFQLGRGERGGG